jgi:hypothetical protein
MSKIEFVSHQSFPEDQYVSELVYLCFEGKYRVAYVRKKAASGGQFWSVVTLGITKNGKKLYVPAFLQDSNFLERDVREYLERREWEKPKAPAAPMPTEKSVFVDDLPF